jgi:hypothetical protein
MRLAKYSTLHGKDYSCTNERKCESKSTIKEQIHDIAGTTKRAEIPGGSYLMWMLQPGDFK